MQRTTRAGLVYRACLTISLCLMIVPALSMAQTYYDNERVWSNNNESLNVRRSEHFRIVWGNGQNPSSNSEYDAATEQMMQANLQEFEHGWHALFDAPPLGIAFRQPNESNNAAYRDGKFYRANFMVHNTGNTSGGGGGSADIYGFPEFGANPAGLRYDPEPDASFHEYGHSILINAGAFNNHKYDGLWHESFCNWLCNFSWWGAGLIYYPVNHNFALNNGRSHYESWMLPELLYEDPRYGKDYIVKLWTQADGAHNYIFDEMIRLHPTGEPDPTNAIKDLIGQVAGRNVTWDYLNKQYYRASSSYVLNSSPYNDLVRRGTTEPIRQPGNATWYRVPFEHAPCQGGYNIIPIALTNKNGAAGYSVSIDFQPLWDAERKSDWRACFVAVNNAGDARYSNMWNSGINTITLSADENVLYLAVAATPDFLAYDASTGPLVTDAPTSPQAYRISFVNTAAKPYLILPIENATPGTHVHSNGGGTVANTAKVDSTAYVGPNAFVLDYAQVAGNARVDGNAVVSGHAVVAGNAQVYGNAKVRDWARIDENARVYEDARVLEHAYIVKANKVHGSATIKGCAQEWGVAADVYGCAIKDADCNNYANMDHGVLMGWVWDIDQARANALPDNQYLYCGYDFDRTSPNYALDKYGITYGYLMGNPQVVNGGATNRGSVLSLNGTNHYVELHRDVSDVRNSTVAVWAKWTGSANDQRIWSFGDGSSKNMYVTPKDTATGKLRFVVSDGTTTQYLDGTTPLAANTWTHIAVTFSGSTYNTTTKKWTATATLYVNGTSVASGTGILVPDQCSGANTADAGNWNFMGRGNSGNYFAGQIDEFRVYNKALSTSEITALQSLAGGTVTAPATDTIAPTPNVATWLVAPSAVGTTAVTMSATKGTDASGWVEYYFDCTAGGGHDSGWISNNKYFDSNLTPGTTYTYTVKMKDKAGNTNTASVAQNVTLPVDTTAPTPAMATFAIAPKGISTTAIKMTATKGTDASPLVEYKFNRVGSSVTSGWQASNIWTDTGLTSGASYSYTVQMRDAYNNAGTISTAVAAVAADQTPPTRYEHGEWTTKPFALVDRRLAMRARSVNGTDTVLSVNIAKEQVWYYFHCASGGGPDSGWISSDYWETPTALPDGTYSYQFKIKDAVGNETPYSELYSGSITPEHSYHDYTMSQLATLPDNYLVNFSGTVIKVNSDGYVVKDTSGSSTIKVRTKYAGNASNLFTNVSVSGGLWTYSGTKMVTFANVTQTGTPTTYTISGKVTGSGGAAISGATVYFSNTSNASVNPATTATTDASGNYSKAVPNGTTWYIAAGSSIYTTSADRTVTVNGANITGINFTLVPMPRISGRVTSSGGIGISGATVCFSSTTSAVLHPTHTATTDAQGYYDKSMPNGTWYIGAYATGYNPSSDQTQIVNGSNIGNVNFALTTYTPRAALVALDAAVLTSGSLSTWANTGTLGGSFGNDGTTPIVETVAGRQCVTFDGTDRMKSTFTSPTGITGNGDYSVIYWVYNPGVGYDECALSWAKRGGPTGTAAAFNYGTSAGWGAVTHWDGPDMGFDGGTPAAAAWHQICITFDGAVEKAYVDGVLNAQENKTLNIGANMAMYLGTAYSYSGTTYTPELPYSGSLASIRVIDSALTASEVLGAYFNSNPICTITTSPGTGGTIAPGGPAYVQYGGSQTFYMIPNVGYSVANVTVDGTSVGAVTSRTISSVTANHNIGATFSTLGRNVPRSDQLVFSCVTDSFPSSGSTGNWATYYPAGQTLTAITTPVVDTINGKKWELNSHADGDGYNYGSFSSPIACNGASVVMAVKPIRCGLGDGGWVSCFDCFYDRMVIGIRDSGQICVRRNGSLDYSTATIPDGQITILSLVIQPDGKYKVYANGTLMMDNTNLSTMTSLVPGVPGVYATNINIGRNNPDKWSTFNGNIGDTFFYKTALTNTERQALEADLAGKFNDLIAYYKFDDTSGTSAIDSSANGKTGTLNGGCTWVAGKTNNGVNLDGINGYVTLPNGLVSGLNDFSIATWVKLDTNNAWNRIFDFGTGTSTYMFLTPKAGTSGVRYAIVSPTSGGEQQINSASALPTGSWQYVVVTLSGTTGILYVNGVEVGRNANMTLKPSGLGTTTQTWIGRSEYSDPYFDGIIDGFKIYNRALSSTEVSSLYGGGAGVASVPSASTSPIIDLNLFDLEPGVLSQWKNDGAAGGTFISDGTTPVVETVDGKKAVTFSGEDWMTASFVAPSTITGDHAFTTSVWAYRPQINVDETILSWATDAQMKAGIAPTYGWHLINVSYDKTNLNLYVDGVLISSERRSLSTTPGMPVILGAAYTTEGSTYYPTLNFTGSIGSVKVFDRALSQKEIITIFKAGF